MRRYEDVQALLICWKDAIKTFQDQRTELQRVLRSPYNFGAEAIDIPSTDPEKYLEDKIRNFREAHDKEQNLLLVYYGGHGDVLRLDGQLIIKCFDGIQHPYVEWNTRQKSFLKGSKADTLIILDCCHSASAIESIYCGQDNVVELLTACSIEGKAPLRGNHSLTSKLTDLLQSKELFTSGFDTSYLYNRLVHYQKLKGQVYLGDDEDEKGVTPLRIVLLSRREQFRNLHICRRITPDSEDEEDDAEINGATGRESEPGKQDSHSQESDEAAHLSATHRSKSYSDVATNTEWDLVIRRESAVSIQNQSVRSVYVDAWTNTTTDTAPLTKRQPAIQALGPVQIEPLTFYREPATRRPWRRKMAIEQDEQERDHRAWFHRYAIFLGQWGMAREEENRTSPYKIALLGTGVDCALILSHDCHQVIRGRNFTSTGENGSWDQEHAGHGASCLTMLLETAPFAEFFIAKITDRQRISNADTIAQSIEYSVKEWKVDMIVLPLGLHIHHDGVANAISQAIRQNIICLAATGNDGANTRAAFPARMHGVIPIFSTDSYGNPSPYNASPMRGRKNFSTFGENVMVWRDDRTDGPSYKSGTSFAVCIAAGMLAAMLVFARDYLQLDERDWNTLHTPAGAEKYLELMSSSRGGYEYVAPWLLISNEILMENSSGSEVDFKNAIKSQIVTALRHLR